MGRQSQPLPRLSFLKLTFFFLFIDTWFVCLITNVQHTTEWR